MTTGHKPTIEAAWRTRERLRRPPQRILGLNEPVTKVYHVLQLYMTHCYKDTSLFFSVCFGKGERYWPSRIQSWSPWKLGKSHKPGSRTVVLRKSVDRGGQRVWGFRSWAVTRWERGRQK